MDCGPCSDDIGTSYHGLNRLNDERMSSIITEHLRLCGTCVSSFLSHGAAFYCRFLKESMFRKKKVFWCHSRKSLDIPPETSELFQFPPNYAEIFQIIPKYSKLFQHIPNYSKLFRTIPNYSDWLAFSALARRLLGRN